MSTANLRILIPEDISRGSVGGPMWRTEATHMDNGRRQVNSPWDYPLHRYEAVYAVRRWPQLERLSAIFHIARGEAYDLLFKDPLDHKSCSISDDPAFDDQLLIASAAGGETGVQLAKAYSVDDIDGAPVAYSRKITRPAYGAMLGKNGAPLIEGADYTVNYDTGSVAFALLAPGDSITWGGVFYVPVYFATDWLDHRLENYRSGQTSVPLLEDRE